MRYTTCALSSSVSHSGYGDITARLISDGHRRAFCMYNVCMNQFVTWQQQKIPEWSTNKTLPATNWSEVVSHFGKSHVLFRNVLELVEFLFCLPERLFPSMNSTWISDKTCLVWAL